MQEAMKSSQKRGGEYPSVQELSPGGVWEEQEVKTCLEIDRSNVFRTW